MFFSTLKESGTNAVIRLHGPPCRFHLCTDACLGSKSSGDPERVGEPSLPLDVCGRKVSFVM